jgi:hypothetical protein
MTNKRHSLDKPLPKSQDRCTQPWWHENPNQEDEGYGSYESKTWPRSVNNYFNMYKATDDILLQISTSNNSQIPKIENPK